MGPSFGQSRVALTGDIEKALLMVSVQQKDCNSLTLLWTRDVNGAVPKVVITHIIFRINSSLFLLNATIDHHMQRYQAIDPHVC